MAFETGLPLELLEKASPPVLCFKLSNYIYYTYV